MRKPRVLIIENSVDVTGALHSVLRSSTLLSGEFEFIFLLPSKSKALTLVSQQGFACVTLPMQEIRKNLLHLALYIPLLIINTIRLKRIISRERIDLLMCNDFYNLLPVVDRFLNGRVPYVCYIRFMPSKFPATLVKIWYRLHSRYAEKLIAVSETVFKELPSHYKTCVIHNEIPLGNNHYQPSFSRVILFPANYMEGKGHAYALKSFAPIATKYHDWILRFVGSDMGMEKNRVYKKSLTTLAEELGLAHQVVWSPFETAMDNAYLDASVVLMFSMSESFSLTCVEAQYYGRALIATRCGGPEEIIQDGVDGLLVPVADVSSMTDALEKVLREPRYREALASAAFHSVRIKFDNEKTLNKLKLVYLEALNGMKES